MEETLASDSSAASNKKLKVVSQEALTPVLVPTVAADSDTMNDDLMEPPNDSEPESENSDDLDDSSSYYDYDEDFSYYDETLTLQAQFDATDLPPGVEAPIPWLEQSEENQKLSSSSATAISPGPSYFNDGSEEDEQVVEMYKQFKSFDTVQDCTDHHFFKGASDSRQPGRDWAKTIQNEWKILEKDLPETIFVRVYEERMELMRAAIIGASGTPYHDGLFFFDILFPSDYPKVPPKVYYHSGGLRLNPNLYNCGKVCLSLLGTWHGSKEEQWIPGQSTMLQVLLSIQALVLNAKPYFNEPGYANMAGLLQGERQSKNYNENTFVLSCKTMHYTLRRPPKHFESFVAGHFRVRAVSILEACKEYLKGTEVGCLAEGEVEEEQEEHDILSDEKTSLKNFRNSLSTVVGNLIPALIKNGAKDCERYIPLGDISRNAPLKI